MVFEIILKGSVQGVGCRYYCGKTAEKMGIPGSASNLINGSVRVLVKTQTREEVENYAYALRTNRFHFGFWGVITSVDINPSGETEIRGDYSWR